ncbi:MAG: radical SAM protein, partial [Bacteroidetes bacterium]|nr:radical SAM protein [Bacteroidota bacterium]
MRKLRIGIIDLIIKGPTDTLWARVMHPNFAAIMPQVIGAWCEKDGHEVTLITYTGMEKLDKEIPTNVDIVFISAFSQAAQLGYALSNHLRKKNIVTVLGGPHARCYPEDSQKYFDYVLGFTDKKLIDDVLDECITHKPMGRHMEAPQQPTQLPGVQERWKFIEPTLNKAPWIKIVPMLGSMGCPYTCSFCIDSVIDYQPFDFDIMKEDLRFIRTKFKRPRVAWHDPNFGIRFDDYLSAIEEAIPPDSIDFIAENSLSLLSEPNLKRLSKNGFKALLPGIESWYELGGKSAISNKKSGREKLEKISDHVNMILDNVPYVQANFVFGLDSDEGPEPFELTKEFIDNVPGVFPGYSLLSAFGRAAPLNLEYQKKDRVLAFPFYFLNNHMAMNVKPLNYAWPDFYDHVIDVTSHTFTNKAIYKRFFSSNSRTTGIMNTVRAISSEGYGRLRYFRKVRKLLDTNTKFRDFFEGETKVVPDFYIDIIKKNMGPFWDWLPEGALDHDPHAYLKAENE